MKTTLYDFILYSVENPVIRANVLLKQMPLSKVAILPYYCVKQNHILSITTDLVFFKMFFILILSVFVWL